MKKCKSNALSRRQFIGNSAATLMAFGLAGATRIAKATDTVSAKNALALSNVPAPVSVVRNNDIANAVANAVTMIGGIPTLTGKSVLIKPNAVCTNPSPYTTSAEVVSALISMAWSAGAATIAVADRSDPGWDTMASFESSRIAQIASSLGTQLMDLGAGTFSTVELPTTTLGWPGGVGYSTAVTGFDYLINVPCYKHHLMANFTGALKNWMGIIDQSDTTGRIWAHGDLGVRLPEIHLGVREDLVVMDATKICLTNGPFGIGEEASPNIVVASTDPVAVDVVAISLLKYYLAQRGLTNPDLDSVTAWTQPQIVHAMEIGIGLTCPEAFQFTSLGIPEIEEILGPPNNPPPSVPVGVESVVLTAAALAISGSCIAGSRFCRRT